jgi:hypothetical protein
MIRMVVRSMTISSFYFAVIMLSLLLHYLLDLADLILNFAGYLFAFAFGFQLRIIAEFPGDLL